MRLRLQMLLAGLLAVSAGAALAFEPPMEAPMPNPPAPGSIVITAAHRHAGYFGFGWCSPEYHGHNKMRWISHLEADLWVDLPSAKELDFYFRAAPRMNGERRQVIGLLVNGALVSEWLCPLEGFSDYHARIPASRLKAGRNRFIFRMAYRKKGGDADRRELALAVRRIVISPTH